MLLAEPIFLSLQGEGPHTGMPSIFIRFYGCNLCCKWCDSLYAVNNPESILDMTTDKVVEEIKKLKCHNIVFTGGEPTLFPKQIQEIQDGLGEGYTYEIETNGSTPILNKFNQINISPKLSNSGNEPYPLRALEQIAFWRTEGSGVCFKFVARGKEDFEDINDYVVMNTIPKSFVYIMPEGITTESQFNDEVLKFCLDNEYRYCQRMHILLFGNKKGV